MCLFCHSFYLFLIIFVSVQGKAVEDTDNRAQHIPFGVWLKKRLKIEEVYNFLTRIIHVIKKATFYFR